MTIPQYQIPSSIFLTLMYLPIDLMGKAEKKKKKPNSFSSFTSFQNHELVPL